MVIFLHSKTIGSLSVVQIIFFQSKTSTTALAGDLLSVPADPPVTCLSFMAQGSVCYEI